MNIFEDIRNFLAEVTSEPIGCITLKTRLREDLHLDGDDVDELLILLKEQFKVDLEGFKFCKYFYDEPHLLSLMSYFWSGLRFGRWYTIPITVSHLIKVIEAGRWLDVESGN